MTDAASSYDVPLKNASKWSTLFPFQPRFETIGGYKYAYIDEGPTNSDGTERPVLLCSHGNPTWSFFFREVVKRFSDKYRVVAVDHIGCGRSEKPSLGKYPYTLARRGNDLNELLDKLEIKNVALIAHDWGGAVGMRAATRRPELYSRLILMNTAAYLSDRVPKRIRLCHTPILNRILLQGLNVFPHAATTMATAKGLSDEVKAGLLAPYDSWSNRIAVCEFVQDIPTSSKHRSYDALKETQEKLSLLKDKPVALIWGVKDWCFPPEVFLDGFLKYYPNAFVRKIEDAGHYLLEDSPEETISAIQEFLETR